MPGLQQNAKKYAIEFPRLNLISQYETSIFFKRITKKMEVVVILYRVQEFLFNSKYLIGLKSVLGGAFAIAFFVITQKLPYSTVTRFISIPILLIFSGILLMKIFWYNKKEGKKTSIFDIGLFGLCATVLFWGFSSL